MEFNQLILPLIITLIAGLSTGLGSFISLFIRKFNKKALCFSLGLSAGVMVYVSFGELLPAAIADIGFLLANVAFFAGILFIMALDFFIPHNYIAEKTKVKGRNKKLMS
ncbi:MAG: zinc transporter ZupT, partial [Nanoarchaeota archaeon]|nr:zinc transporter ZupT [Nanoarchaeota archaeon]